jgi:hypothetical protein
VINESIEEDLISEYGGGQVLEEILKETSMTSDLLNNSSDPLSASNNNSSEKEPFVHARIVVADD